MYNIPNSNDTSYSFNYLLLMSGRQQHQYSFNDSYTALILEEAEKFYNELTTKLKLRYSSSCFRLLFTIATNFMHHTIKGSIVPLFQGNSKM
ncbi:MAG TPA: hypothetical protein VE226_00990 [Nitrososphaeraceae archaeon]|nr:hypothetical protein [Nitrososphaeraceae archaeon]